MKEELGPIWDKQTLTLEDVLNWIICKARPEHLEDLKEAVDYAIDAETESSRLCKKYFEKWGRK